MGSVTDACFIESPLPPRSWVTLGPQYGMKQALSRMKQATMRTAVATLLWQIFSPEQNGAEISEKQPLPQHLAHSFCRAARGRWKAFRMRQAAACAR